MIGQLPKSEAWKQSVPGRLSLLLHPRYSSGDSVRIYKILGELLHLSKLEPRKSIEPQRIPTELPRSRYAEGSQQAGRPSGP
jgi:hypothetical protein